MSEHCPFGCRIRLAGIRVADNRRHEDRGYAVYVYLYCIINFFLSFSVILVDYDSF